MRPKRRGVAINTTTARLAVLIAERLRGGAESTSEVPSIGSCLNIFSHGE